MDHPKVIGKNILVRLAEPEATKKGVIITMGNTSEHRVAVVIDMGANVEEISVGNKVVISSYGGIPLKHNGNDYLILNVENIFAIVEWA